jgi:hypothetical protein
MQQWDFSRIRIQQHVRKSRQQESRWIVGWPTTKLKAAESLFRFIPGIHVAIEHTTLEQTAMQYHHLLRNG